MLDQRDQRDQTRQRKKEKSFATKELLEKARFSPGLAEDRPVSGLSNSKGPVSFSLSLSFSFLFRFLVQYVSLFFYMSACLRL